MAIEEPESALPALTIRLFGPCEVRVHGSPIPRLRSRKTLWLLALLALRHGREVERAWLAGMLWPDSTDTQARGNLITYLKDLRKALGPEKERLRSPTSRTLVLDLEGAEADVVAFDETAARGDAASLEEAVALYGGPLLEGCEEEWVFEERRAREQAYLTALEALAAEASTRGDPDASAQCLQRVLAVDPLRETALRSLMEALAAAGNHGAAMAAYQDWRRRLHRELNAEPSAETTALFQQIRSEARGQAQGRRTTKDQRPTTNERSTGRHPFTLSPPHPLTPSPPHRIPRPLTELIGREPQITEITAHLTSARLVTLTGPGGVGKTRLAIRVAEQVADEYAHEAWFVDLAPLADPALVPRAVASALGLQQSVARPVEADLLEFLRGKQLLLVLDNCEHVVTECARLADALLRECPEVQILATSREELGAEGEMPCVVPPLTLPDVEALPTAGPELLSLVAQSEAVRLFAERATRREPRFALSEANARAVAHVCRRLDGIPLAIEMAAARAKGLSVQEIDQRLEQGFQLLVNPRRTPPPRQQTLRATMDWSYNLLSTPAQALLRRLSAFAGAFTLEAAEAVCGGARTNDQCPMSNERTDPEPHWTLVIGHWSLPEGEVVGLLGELVDKSLVVVVRECEEGQTRYRLLEVVRQYGREKLRECGEDEATRDRHLEYFLGLAERAEPGLRGVERAAWVDRLEQERDNLRTALDWSVSEGGRQKAEGRGESSGLPSASCLLPSAATAGLRLAAALHVYWIIRGCWQEGRERLAALLSLSDRGAMQKDRQTGEARAKALAAAGRMAFDNDDPRAAPPLCEESLALYRALGMKREAAAVLRHLARARGAMGDLEGEQALWEECLAMHREAEDSAGLAAALQDMGIRAGDRYDFDLARTLLEESLAIRWEIGDKAGIASSLRYLGSLAHADDFNTARARYEESLALCREMGHHDGIAYSLLQLGRVARHMGDYSFARACWEEMLTMWEATGDRANITRALVCLGCVAYDQGEYETARAEFARGLGLYQESENKRGMGTCRYHLGRVALCLGDEVGARRMFEEAMTLQRKVLHKDWIAINLEGAAVRYVRAPTMWKVPGTAHERAIVAELWRAGPPDAALPVPHSSLARAALLFGAAETIRELAARETGASAPDPHPPTEQQVAALRAALGEAAFAAAWARGRQMTLEEAIWEMMIEDQ